MTTAEQEWKEFEKAVMDESAPDIQRQEMRRAFFAGQFALIQFQLNEVAAAPDREAEAGFAERKQELEDYFCGNFQKRN